MNIGTLQTHSRLPGSEPDILQMLREKNAQTSSAKPLAETANGPQNMMQGNFVQAQSEESRYVAAMKNSLTVSMQLQDSMRSDMTSLVGGLGKVTQDGTLSAGAGGAASVAQSDKVSVGHAVLQKAGIDPASVGSGAGASMVMQRMSAKQVTEASEETLDTMKDDIEQRTEEAVAPEETTGEENTKVATSEERTESTSPPASVSTGASPNASPGVSKAAPTENNSAPSAENGEMQAVPSQTTTATGAGTSDKHESVDILECFAIENS